MSKWLTVLFFFPLIAFQCDKSTAGKCLKGKIVRITCASIVIEVLNDHTIGEDGWKGTMPIGTSYNNVFKVANKCDLGDSFRVGDTLHFTIAEPGKEDCIVCAMYDAPPEVKFAIKDVSKTPCKTQNE